MRLPHVIPFKKAPLYFFTTCTADRRPLLGTKDALDMLSDIWQRSSELDQWYVGRFVLMPDHVHFFASPSQEAKTREVWTKMWKSVSARLLLEELNLNHFGKMTRSITFCVDGNRIGRNGTT